MKRRVAKALRGWADRLDPVRVPQFNITVNSGPEAPSIADIQRELKRRQERIGVR